MTQQVAMKQLDFSAFGDETPAKNVPTELAMLVYRAGDGRIFGLMDGEDYMHHGRSFSLNWIVETLERIAEAKMQSIDLRDAQGKPDPNKVREQIRISFNNWPYQLPDLAEIWAKSVFNPGELSPDIFHLRIPEDQTTWYLTDAQTQAEKAMNLLLEVAFGVSETGELPFEVTPDPEVATKATLLVLEQLMEENPAIVEKVARDMGFNPSANSGSENLLPLLQEQEPEAVAAD